MEIEITRLHAQVAALMGQLQSANKTPPTGRQFSWNAFSGSVTKPAVCNFLPVNIAMYSTVITYIWYIGGCMYL